MINHKVSNTLRRSALYMPATNQRAMTKAQSLPADVIIFDFEDAVAPCDKGLARQTLCEQLAHANYGPRELVLRINAVDSAWYYDDIKYLPELLATLPQVYIYLLLQYRKWRPLMMFWPFSML